MRTITQLREDIKVLLDKLGNLRGLCLTEKRDPNDDEIRIAEDYLTEIDGLEKNLALELRTQETLDRMKAPATVPDKPPINTKNDPNQQSRDSFAAPGEFFQAVMRAGCPGGPVDPRLSTRTGEGMSETVPSDGGFLVDTEMGGGILKNVWEASPILSRISKTTLSGNKNGMKFNGIDETSRATGSRFGGITGYWKAEAALKTKSKPTFRQIELNLNKLIGLTLAPC